MILLLIIIIKQLIVMTIKFKSSSQNEESS